MDSTDSTEAGRIIPSPTQWVALSADFTRDFPGDQIDVAGRYFRASDGSDRVETGPPNEPARVVFIRNIPESTYYSRRVDKDGSVYWLSGPMQLPKDGWQPPKMKEIVGRIALLEEEYEGRAVAQVSSKGSIKLMAPSLNFLPLVNRHVVSGYQERTGTCSSVNSRATCSTRQPTPRFAVRRRYSASRRELSHPTSRKNSHDRRQRRCQRRSGAMRRTVGRDWRFCPLSVGCERHI